MITIDIKKLGEGSFTDRTDQIESVQVVQGTTKEATTGSLSVTYTPSREYFPSGEDEVEIYDGAEKIFGGFIVRISKTRQRDGSVIYTCDLKNKVHRLDYELVNISLEEISAHDAIVEIVDTFSGPGITYANVEDDPLAEITSITFNNILPSEAIQMIADQFGKEWYVDVDGDIHFFSKLTEEAPFDLTDDGGKYIFDSLEIEEDYTQIKNSMIVEAGDELSTIPESDEITVVGDAKTFPLSRQYASGLTATVNGVAITIGAANLDSYDDYDALYDFNAQALYFDPSGTVVADGDIIVVTGNYYFPIAVRYNDGGSISLYGRREFLIQDKSIKSRTDAIARAQAELLAYANPVKIGSFETNESGLRAGMRISIVSALRGMNEEFVIQRLTGSMETPTKFIWKAEVVSVKSFELIDLLAQIIKGNRKETPVGAVITTAERFTRGIKVGRVINTYLNDPPIWVAGPYIPSSLADRHRVAFTDRSALTT